MATEVRKGTIRQFIPKTYQHVPSVTELMGYYTKKDAQLDDTRAFGMIILDDKEQEAPYYASVSYLMNHLNRMKEALKVHDRVAVHYERAQDGTNLIRSIKLLPVFFEHNQAHDKDKDVPAYIRRGDRGNDKAQVLNSFNPPLATSQNLRDDQAQVNILSSGDVKKSQDTKLSMHDVVMQTLDHAQFRQQTDLLFQKAADQTQRTIDAVFDSHYLDFMDSFDQIHENTFVNGYDKGPKDTKEAKTRRKNISSMDL